ncbi:MAG: transcription antitermination factor NusB [Elusimicrobia bacterium]|nr:transcription antitermination factor NusB [Elusimicrobiota bacterium]
MGKRRKSREVALQTLYLVDVAHLSFQQAFRFVEEEMNGLDKESVDFAKQLTEGTLNQLEEIDKHIKTHAQNWDLPRMAAVDRNLLRLSAYELLEEKDTPIKVIIDEALEIAKKYSSEDSSKFINGILDKIKDYRDKDYK